MKTATMGNELTRRSEAFAERMSQEMDSAPMIINGQSIHLLGMLDLIEMLSLRARHAGDTESLDLFTSLATEAGDIMKVLEATLTACYGARK